eukprot:Opistho-1_new@28618
MRLEAQCAKGVPQSEEEGSTRRVGLQEEAIERPLRKRIVLDHVDLLDHVLRLLYRHHAVDCRRGVGARDDDHRRRRFLHRVLGCAEETVSSYGHAVARDRRNRRDARALNDGVAHLKELADERGGFVSALLSHVFRHVLRLEVVAAHNDLDGVLDNAPHFAIHQSARRKLRQIGHHLLQRRVEVQLRSAREVNDAPLSSVVKPSAQRHASSGQRDHNRNDDNDDERRVRRGRRKRRGCARSKLRGKQTRSLAVTAAHAEHVFQTGCEPGHEVGGRISREDVGESNAAVARHFHVERSNGRRALAARHPVQAYGRHGRVFRVDDRGRNGNLKGQLSARGPPHVLCVD